MLATRGHSRVTPGLEHEGGCLLPQWEELLYPSSSGEGSIRVSADVSVESSATILQNDGV